MALLNRMDNAVTAQVSDEIAAVPDVEAHQAPLRRASASSERHWTVIVRPSASSSMEAIVSACYKSLAGSLPAPAESDPDPSKPVPRQSH